MPSGKKKYSAEKMVFDRLKEKTNKIEIYLKIEKLYGILRIRRSGKKWENEDSKKDLPCR